MITEGEDRAEAMRQYLARIDEPCPRCGYSLKGLEGTACPECGCAIELTAMAPRTRRMVWHTAGLVGLSSGFGFCGFTFAWAFHRELETAVGFLAEQVRVAFVGGILSGAALGIWWHGREWIERRAPALQIAMVLGCWGLSACLATVFALTL